MSSINSNTVSKTRELAKSILNNSELLQNADRYLAAMELPVRVHALDVFADKHPVEKSKAEFKKQHAMASLVLAQMDYDEDPSPQAAEMLTKGWIDAEIVGEKIPEELFKSLASTSWKHHCAVYGMVFELSAPNGEREQMAKREVAKAEYHIALENYQQDKTCDNAIRVAALWGMAYSLGVEVSEETLDSLATQDPEQASLVYEFCYNNLETSGPIRTEINKKWKETCLDYRLANYHKHKNNLLDAIDYKVAQNFISNLINPILIAANDCRKIGLEVDETKLVEVAKDSPWFGRVLYYNLQRHAKDEQSMRHYQKKTAEAELEMAGYEYACCPNPLNIIKLAVACGKADGVGVERANDVLEVLVARVKLGGKGPNIEDIYMKAARSCENRDKATAYLKKAREAGVEMAQERYNNEPSDCNAKNLAVAWNRADGVGVELQVNAIDKLIDEHPNMAMKIAAILKEVSNEEVSKKYSAKFEELKAKENAKKAASNKLGEVNKGPDKELLEAIAGLNKEIESPEAVSMGK